MKKKLKSAPWPIILLIFSFVCPVELSLFLGDMKLPPHRIALILLVPWAMIRMMMRPDIRFRGYDLFFLLFGVWTLWAYRVHDPIGGFVYGGSIALECTGAYLVPRAWIRDIDQLRATLRVMLYAIGAAALLALPETLFGKIYTHDFLAQVTGYYHPTGVERRAGSFTRAYSVFDHPIHYGTFCAGLFAMFWFAEKRTMKRGARSAMIGGATVLGISSAPLLCIGLQLGMLTWEYITRQIKSRTAITMAAMFGLYLGFSLVANRSPMHVIATGLTIDPWTGFYRLKIWEYGLENVATSPMFGIGLADWARPSWMVSPTVDAFWLVIMMRTGVPALLLVSIAIFWLGRSVVKRSIKSRDKDIKQLATGWMMSLIALCLIASTVHFWNVLSSFFFFFMGLGGWAADPKKMKANKPKATASAYDPLDQYALPSSLNTGPQLGGGNSLGAPQGSLTGPTFGYGHAIPVGAS
jgi:hypothetical protein